MRPTARRLRAALHDSLRTLGTVLRLPGVPAVAVTSTVARLPKGMLPLATVLLLHRATGSFAVAGAAAAMVAFGDAASAPAQARLVDRFGPGRTLIPAAAVHVAALVALASMAGRGAPAAAMVACAGVAGIGIPPVSGTVKALWPRLVGPDRVPAAYAVESLLQQIVFLVGPLLLAALVATGGPTVAFIACAALAGGGTVAFVVVAAARGAGGHRRHRPGGALRVGTLRVVMACTVLQSTTFGALPVGLAAVTAGAGRTSLSGVLLAALTVGGLLGALWPVTAAGRRQYIRLAGAFATCLVPVALLGTGSSVGSLVSIGVALTVVGVFVTPLAAVSYVLVERATAPEHRTEAFAWLSTGQAAGGAIGAGLAGVLTGGAGPAIGLAVPPVAAAAAVALAGWALSRRSDAVRPTVARGRTSG